MPVWTKIAAAKACSCWSYIVVRRMLHEWFTASRLHLALSSAPLILVRLSEPLSRTGNSTTTRSRHGHKSKKLRGFCIRTTQVTQLDCFSMYPACVLNYYTHFGRLDKWTKLLKSCVLWKCTTLLPNAHPDCYAFDYCTIYHTRSCKQLHTKQAYIVSTIPNVQMWSLQSKTTIAQACPAIR